MKTIEAFFIGLLATLVLAACQDDTETVTYTNGETGNVTFELDASALHQNPLSRTFSPSYSKDGFSIYAFKQADNGDYVFTQEVSLGNMAYTDSDKKLKGTANLPIGTYKFLSAYGAKQEVFNGPTWSGAVLTNNLALSYNTSTLMNEVFLATDMNAINLPDYDLGLDNSTNPTVTATLKRAVARVDVMFISATKKQDGTYTEEPYVGEASNIFNDQQLEQVELRYNNINPSINMFGSNNSTTRVSRNFNLNSLDYMDPDGRVVIGNGLATLIGNNDYTRYDNVQAGDIISGGAHIFGTYLFPNGTDETTDLDIYIKPVNGTGRTIAISDVPLEQNRVTLVKVYVLNGNHVFSTTVDFEVEIDIVWETANDVNGSIS